VAVTSPPYPAPGRATALGDPANSSPGPRVSNHPGRLGPEPRNPKTQKSQLTFAEIIKYCSEDAIANSAEVYVNIRTKARARTTKTGDRTTKTGDRTARSGSFPRSLVSMVQANMKPVNWTDDARANIGGRKMK
jgi:hypothetical protein